LAKNILKTDRQFSTGISHFLTAALLLTLFCFALSAERFYFLFKYRDAFFDAGLYKIGLALLRGVRFDLATASIISVPFILLLAPGLSRRTGLLRASGRILLIWYAVLLSYNFIDIEYYAFVRRHLTFELASSWRDTDMILKIGLARYLPETIGFAAFVAFFCFIFVKISVRHLPSPDGRLRIPGLMTAAKETAALLLTAVLLLVFIRGGFQMKPLGVRNAFTDEKMELGMLSLNGIYTTLSTLYNKKNGGLSSRISAGDTPSYNDVLPLIAAGDSEKAHEGYPLFRELRYEPEERQRLNVVIFIMESWSAKFMKSLGGRYDTTPFFDRLSQGGLLLTNCFANAQRSVEGLSSILGSVPTWDGMILGQDGLLSQTRLEHVGNIFGSYGYDTLFIYGARPGSMGFDSLIRRLGFRTHISRDDFAVNKTTDDGVWGIFDEYVFARAHEEFSKKAGPFFAVVYSLTSHTPYRLPSSSFSRFGPSVPHRDFLNAVGYSDYALEKFFEKARSASYFNDTLFVIVGDHTEGSSTGGNLYDSFRIPCLFYCPKHLPHGIAAEIASQIDIVPTIFDILRISHPFTSWGKTVFDKGDRAALLPHGESVVWVRGNYMLQTDLSSVSGLYDYRGDPGKDLTRTGGGNEPDKARRMTVELRDYLRFSYDRIRTNTVMPPATERRSP